MGPGKVTLKSLWLSYGDCVSILTPCDETGGHLGLSGVHVMALVVRLFCETTFPFDMLESSCR